MIKSCALYCDILKSKLTYGCLLSSRSPGEEKDQTHNSHSVAEIRDVFGESDDEEAAEYAVDNDAEQNSIVSRNSFSIGSRAVRKQNTWNFLLPDAVHDTYATFAITKKIKLSLSCLRDPLWKMKGAMRKT